MVVTLIAFDGMAVGTLMPVAVRELDGLGYYAWGFSAFFIATLAGTVLAGEWADRRGPGAPLLAGVGAFAIGLVLSGGAPAMVFFVLARGIQGLGGGLIIVTVYVMILRAYGPWARPRAFAAISSAWVLPSLVGPALAGLVAQHVGWRWVFLGLVPLVLPAVALMLPTVRRGGVPDGPEPAAGPGRGWGRVLTSVAVAAGAALVLYAGQRMDWLGLIPFAAGLPLLTLGLPRLLPPGALGLRRGLPAVVAMRGLLTGAFFGVEAFIPLSLVSLRGFSPTLAGLVLTGGALGWALGSWYQGRPEMRVPRFRLVRWGALLIGAADLAALASLHLAGGGAWLVLPAWALAGLGMGLSMSSVSVLTMELAPPGQQGASSSALQLSDTLGSALATGLGGVVVTSLGRAGLSLGWGITAVDGLALLVAMLAVAAASRLRS